MSIRSKAATDAYRDGWDRTFGQDDEDENLCHECDEMLADDEWGDGTLCYGCYEELHGPQE